jgi:CRISPR-associated protein (TIGR03986 family)
MKDGKLVFFGHTMMFRLPYDRTPYEFVPPGLRAETSDVDIDLAEAIFGFTSRGKEGNRGSRAGRISFGDARLEPGQSDIWLSSGHPVIPKILSGPKPTAFQHYLTQQQPDEVPSTNKNGTPKLELRLDHYASPPPHETVIRGHKLYWHKGSVGLSDIKDSRCNGLQVDSKHTLIKPVKAGVRFRSTIHFENLSRVELGAVLWTLVLPGEQGREYRHKIGMGKPLGMGSVKLVPKLYLDDRKSRYSRLFEG